MDVKTNNNIAPTFPNQPDSSAEDLVPPEKVTVNPFNGVSDFAAPNYPPGVGAPVPGAIYGGNANYAGGGDPSLYALIFQGTDSSSTDFNDPDCFHAVMANTLEGLRNGIFIAQSRD